MAWIPLLMGLLSKLFAFLSWPSFALFCPLYASFWAMETQSHSKNQQCLAFWVLFALFAMMEHTFAKLLLWLPLWPHMKGMMTFLLVMPYFGGASHVYKRIDNFVNGTDKKIFVNGQEELEKNVICQKKLKPSNENGERDFKPIISNKVQKEWSCALCLISTSSEKCFRGHLQSKKHKAKEEEIKTEELALMSSNMANRKNGAVLLGNLVNLQNWSCLVGPVAGSIRWCSWKKPDVGWFKLNTDGSIARENAGLGGLLRDFKGDAICAFVSKAPLDDIFLVELCAIWRGLVLALGLGVKVVWVESDSMGAVKTINRKQSHNGKADNCLKQIWALLKKFDKYKVTHSWRETNKAADYLSRMASDKYDEVLWPAAFPQSLLKIIMDDAQGKVYLRR